MITEMLKAQAAELKATECVHREAWIRLVDALIAAFPTGGVAQIAEERQRQITDEGWTPEHDDEHSNDELACAAAAYAMSDDKEMVEMLWPWQRQWWKPKDRKRDLVRAGALIAAEIDRLERAGK
jgi:hypothetical protein